jgi:hypothetical protein
MDRVFLCDAHDVERNLSGLDETGAAERGRDDLVVTTAGRKEIAEFTMLATEAAGGVRALDLSGLQTATFWVRAAPGHLGRTLALVVSEKRRKGCRRRPHVRDWTGMGKSRC